MVKFKVALLFSLWLCACSLASNKEEIPVSNSLSASLADTQWQLVEFQSMSNLIGTLRPSEPEKFTMVLNNDGTATLQLGCNQAQGTWSAVPGADGSSGQFSFGPLASTRAMCPPPRLDERFASDAKFVRGYLLKDGNLNLSLMADGGIYVWQPLKHPVTQQVENPKAAETSAVTTAATTGVTRGDAKIEAAILRTSPEYSKITKEIGGMKARYAYIKFDLNGDGTEEVLVYLLGSYFCGTGGCNMLLLEPAAEGYKVINKFAITQLPVIASPVESAGWKDIIRVEAGGGAPATFVRHKFTGQHYIERERMPKTDQLPGEIIFADSLSFSDGITLEPR
ncbi:MAG: META domain-containing protein [Bdellovibrionales bacterium]|nr:META domain-containing protein [Bdellovibrionales bacterium]